MVLSLVVSALTNAQKRATWTVGRGSVEVKDGSTRLGLANPDVLRTLPCPLSPLAVPIVEVMSCRGINFGKQGDGEPTVQNKRPKDGLRKGEESYKSVTYAAYNVRSPEKTLVQA